MLPDKHWLERDQWFQGCLPENLLWIRRVPCSWKIVSHWVKPMSHLWTRRVATSASHSWIPALWSLQKPHPPAACSALQPPPPPDATASSRTPVLRAAPTRPRSNATPWRVAAGPPPWKLRCGKGNRVRNKRFFPCSVFVLFTGHVAVIYIVQGLL